MLQEAIIRIFFYGKFFYTRRESQIMDRFLVMMSSP